MNLDHFFNKVWWCRFEHNVEMPRNSPVSQFIIVVAALSHNVPYGPAWSRAVWRQNKARPRASVAVPTLALLIRKHGGETGSEVSADFRTIPGIKAKRKIIRNPKQKTPRGIIPVHQMASIRLSHLLVGSGRVLLKKHHVSNFFVCCLLIIFMSALH